MKRNKKILYESIMRDVSKTIKRRLNESTNRFYPEDWEVLETGQDVINAILEALYQSGIYKSFSKSVNYGRINTNVFTNENFLNEFGKQLTENFNEYFKEWLKEEYDENDEDEKL